MIIPESAIKAVSYTHLDVYKRQKPDGGIIKVKDDNNEWRIVLVLEAKHQGKDIENIKNGILVGKADNQDLMAAENAIK